MKSRLYKKLLKQRKLNTLSLLMISDKNTKYSFDPLFIVYLKSILKP